jgi:hypothetical protein
MSSHQVDQIKSAADVLSYFIVVGSIVNLLPTIATILSIVWLSIQISQSQRFLQLAGWIAGTWRRLRGR